MSNVKNFGLDGVASSVQLGKGGSKLASESGKITAKDADGDLVQIQAADPVSPQDVMTKAVVDALDGMDFVLGTPTDSSLAGAVALTNETTVTNAVDKLNEILGKLVPTSPATFPNGESLTVASVGTTPLLASGAVPDNTNGGTIPVSAGNSVVRVTAATVATNTIGAGDNVGPGDSGTVQALVNGAVIDSQVMSTGANNKGTGVLRITADQAYPVSTPGFWESFRAQIGAGAASQGWNRYQLNHTGGGSTNQVYVVRDNITAAPVVSSFTVTEGTQGTLAYSSGVPHYGTSGELAATFTASNLSGETYKSGTILSLSASNSAAGTVNFAAGQGGLASVLARQLSTFTASALALPINGTNVHNTSVITASASNPNGTGTANASTTILVKRGTAGSRIDEMAVPVTVAVNGGPTGNGERVVMAAGDTPSTVVTSLTAGDWDSSATPSSHEAAIVGGLLKQDQVNYSTGYLPAGPNRASMDATQYVTFMFRRTAVSKFDIAINGTYTQIWVKLPGLSETYANNNGWYSMSTLYGGAGIPGNQGGANGSLGCALGAVASGSGSFTATFGTLSSTSAANNIILVRIKLATGQSVNSLSFVPATR